MNIKPYFHERIHMKHQALFSSKDKSNKLKCRLLQFLFGTVRVKATGKRITCTYEVFIFFMPP